MGSAEESDSRKVLSQNGCKRYHCGKCVQSLRDGHRFRQRYTEKTQPDFGIQVFSQFFYAAGSIILKGYSSTAQNVAAVLRNLAAIKNIKSKTVE